MKSSSILLAILASVVLAGPSLGQTTDGTTPADESVCDALRDGTKGLYGLCVAFCEAQDAASYSVPLTEAEVAALASSTPSGRILENYNRRKTPSDPAMPCIKVEEPCPCWDQAELEGVIGNGRVIEACYINNEYYKEVFDGSALVDLTDNLPTEYIVTSVASRHFAPKFNSEYQCEYSDFKYSTSTGSPVFEYNTTRRLEITAEQYVACRRAVEERAVTAGLTCQVFD